MTQSNSVQFTVQKEALATIHNNNISSWVESRGTEPHKYWVVVYRNYRDMTGCEYVAETQWAAHNYINKNPKGEGLIFNKIKS